MVIDFLRKRVWGGISSKKIDVLVDLGILQVKAYPNYPLKICVRHIFFWFPSRVVTSYCLHVSTISHKASP
jgi:hypothetical protein